MSSRKRPAESRSRGNSPPDKRARPPDRSLSMQDKYAQDLFQGPARSPSSRTGSIAGLSDNVPRGPRHAPDGNRVDPHRTGTNSDATNRRRSNGVARPLDDQQRRPSVVHSPLHMQSPGSASGASTPVHGAPPAPSMLPRVGSALAGTASLKYQERPLVSGAPLCLASLRKLRLRKQAIANEARPKGRESPPSAPLNARLKAQQIEITYLKKERENMSERLKVLESLPDQMRELMARLDEARPHSEAVQLLDARMVELETTQHLLSRVEALETTMAAERAMGLSQLTELTCRVDTLMGWKSQQPTRPEITEMVKDVAPSISQATMQNTEARPDKRIDAQQKLLTVMSDGFGVLDDFRKDIESKKYDVQVQNLVQKINDVDRNEGKTYKKVTTLMNDIERYIGPMEKEFEMNDNTLVERTKRLGLVVGQVKNFQSEQGKLANEQKKLTADQDELSKEQGRHSAELKLLAARVSTLEKKPTAPSPGFKKLGIPVTSLSTKNTNASVDIITQRLDQVDNDIKDIRTSCASVEALSFRITQVENRMTSLSKFPERMAAMEAQCSQFTDRLSGLNALEDTRISLATLRSDLSKLEAQNQPTPMHSSDLTNQYAELSSKLSHLDETVNFLNHDFDELEGKVHDRTTRLEVLETGLPIIIQDSFDPFKRDIEQKITELGHNIGGLDGEIAEVQHHSPRKRSSAHEPDAEVHHQAQLTQLQTALAHESSERHRAIREIQQEVASKSDRVDMEQQINRIALCFKGLQDQYNNITTDDLHGKMVQWFLQNYPSSTANMVQQFASLRHDVNTLKDLSAQISWIQFRQQDLSALLTSAPQLQALASSFSGNLLQQTLARVEEAFNNATKAMSVAEAADSKTNNQMKQISSVQQSLHNLNSASAQVSKGPTKQGVDNSLRDLQKEIKTGLADARDSCVRAINDEHNERVNAANELRTAVERNLELQMKALEGSVVEMISTRFKDFQETSASLRHDVDTINNEYITPNRELFGLFGNVLIVIGQLQLLLESINMNLVKGPIAFKWHMDLNSLESREIGEIGSSNVEDKNKQ
ncbi:hypothetical protein CC86DRAFT_370496 [Ophiobolus disseminans]|uniref:Uncharacterized protein n=1 Tax=Ophiobolus disseminans TaxID=1469910 RepID=A0A6A6ZZN8_9PLEO|nr:hypothetical protein CC86DRAFT_370496 [Ophiobolus disseminans]